MTLQGLTLGTNPGKGLAWYNIYAARYYRLGGLLSSASPRLTSFTRTVPQKVPFENHTPQKVPMCSVHTLLVRISGLTRPLFLWGHIDVTRLH